MEKFLFVPTSEVLNQPENDELSTRTLEEQAAFYQRQADLARTAATLSRAGSQQQEKLDAVIKKNQAAANEFLHRLAKSIGKQGCIFGESRPELGPESFSFEYAQTVIAPFGNGYHPKYRNILRRKPVNPRLRQSTK